MWLALKIVAVLEGAGLALIAIDGEVAWGRLRAHELPFTKAREACTAEPAKPSLFKGGKHRVDRERAASTGLQLSVAASSDIVVIRLVVRDDRTGGVRRNCRFDRFCRRMIDMAMADFGDGRRVATPHAGRAHNTDFARIDGAVQRVHQRVRTHHLASQAVADADGQLRRCCLPLFDRIEMRIEGRDLVNLSLRETHLFGKRPHMSG